MRKFVVPIAALAGIALLSPHADAANLIIKSRAGKLTRPVSLPVMVNGVGGTAQLWGIDFAVTYDSTKLASVNDATTGAAFTPQAVTGSTETPVVVSGAPTVGTGVANPTLYVGYVRGTSAMPTFAGNIVANTAGTNSSPGIGLLRLSVTSGTAGTVLPLTVANYNVANDGTGATTISRAGATGATSDVASGAAVTAETVTLLDYAPGLSAPTTNYDVRVPLHSVAIGVPGNCNTTNGVPTGIVGSTDLQVMKWALSNAPEATRIAKWTPYARIAADIAPLNGYTPTAISGPTGQGYGDGLVSSTDLLLMKQFLVHDARAANFPVAE